jgi:hypothetical protein
MFLCWSTVAVAAAMAILWATGYSDVHSLKAGFGAWVAAGAGVSPFLFQHSNVIQIPEQEVGYGIMPGG